MEVGIIDRLSSLQKSFNSSIDNRLSLDSIQAASNRVLDVKLGAQSKQLANFYNDQDDEGEIMLLAMILLQLHGVKIPAEDDLLNKKKRQRTSPDQLAILEDIFQTDKMPNQQTRIQLADQLGMSSRRVQIWFQNKRAKVKRSSSKPEDGECSSPSELDQSSSSISPASSPSSPSVPELEIESPMSDSSEAVPQISPIKQILQVSDATIISSPSTLSSIQQLKAQQLTQFSRPSPFTDSQPVLTASY